MIELGSSAPGTGLNRKNRQAKKPKRGIKYGSHHWITLISLLPLCSFVSRNITHSRNGRNDFKSNKILDGHHLNKRKQGCDQGKWNIESRLARRENREDQRNAEQCQRHKMPAVRHGNGLLERNPGKQPAAIPTSQPQSGVSATPDKIPTIDQAARCIEESS